MVPHESVESLRASAEEDLWTANLVKDRDDEKTRIICFHLQQYAEKMLKAKLLEKGIQYPRKHDLVSLLELFDNKEILDKHIENAANLSDYATAFRYERRVPSIEEMEAAFTSAQSMVSDINSL